MAVAHSKLTSQGQISVPLDVRRKLGVGPGSILEWEEKGDSMLVRRAVRFNSEDIHQALFPKSKLGPHSLQELKEGVRTHVRKRYGRG